MGPHSLQVAMCSSLQIGKNILKPLFLSARRSALCSNLPSSDFAKLFLKIIISVAITLEIVLQISLTSHPESTPFTRLDYPLQVENYIVINFHVDHVRPSYTEGRNTWARGEYGRRLPSIFC